MPKCPQCENGKMKINFEVYGKPETKSVTEIDCIHCNGTGEISQEEIDQIEWEKKQWCSCENRDSSHVKFHPRGTKRCRKHHYTCTDCGGIVQIG